MLKAKRSNVVSLNTDDNAKKDKQAEETAKREEAERLSAKMRAKNQKFALIHALLRRGTSGWEHARPLLERMRQCAPADNPLVIQSLCELLKQVLEPYYAPLATTYRLFGSKSGVKAAAVPEEDYLALPSLMTPILSHMGHRLNRDATLFTQLCRVLVHVLKVMLARQNAATSATDASSSSSAEDNVVDEISVELENILCVNLLPSFSLLPANVALSNELWSVLSRMSYQVRYRLYGAWRDSSNTSSEPELIAMRLQAVSSTKYFRKRVAASRVKECGRMLVKFCLPNPLICFQLILEQIQAFDNMIPVVVEGLKYLTKLCFDCLSFELLTQLTTQSELKPKLKDDGVNESHWFQSLASFAGQLHRKYPETSLAALLQAVVNQVKDERSLDLLILKELLSHMGGVEAMEEISEAQLEGQAGGRTLQIETTPSRSKGRKRAVQYLLDGLLRADTVASLSILISQHKQHIVYHTESNHVKLIGELYDKTQAVRHPHAVYRHTYIRI